VLGDAGEVVDEPLELPPIEPLELLPEVLPLVPVELLVPPLLELDLLKYASHSEREIWPSLFVSTDEKLGVVALPLELELGELELPLAADEGEDEDGLLLEEEEYAAAAASDRAKSAAAVVTVTVLSISNTPLKRGGEMGSTRLRASAMPSPPTRG